MPARFGDFQPLCSGTPSYPWCNLFYRQLLRSSPNTLTGLSKPTSTAPVGVNPSCGIPRQIDVHIGRYSYNILNTLACAGSMAVVIYLIVQTYKRKAAVGRVELLAFLTLYFLTLPLQAVTTGSYLRQGSTALVVITAVHAGVVVVLFWSLLANAIIATQVVEDGSMSSLIPFCTVSVIIFVVTVYISLDVSLGITTLIGGVSSPPEALKSIPLFILTSIWPTLTAILYFVIMLYIAIHNLMERRPVLFYVIAACLFVLSQLVWLLLGRAICKASHSAVDGSFVATVLETACLGTLWFGWKSITDEEWDNPYL